MFLENQIGILERCDRRLE